MRLIANCLIAMLLAGSTCAAEVGKPAPSFSVTDINGRAESLEQYRGKIVVLEWNNPLCPFVRKHYGSGNMQKLQAYALSRGIIWLTVNSSAREKEGYMSAAEAREQTASVGAHQTAYIVDPEGSLGRLYNAKATPHMFVIDKQGRLAYEGAIDDKPTPDPGDIASADNYVKDAVDALLSGNDVKLAQTRTYGCSVKYKD